MEYDELIFDARIDRCRRLKKVIVEAASRSRNGEARAYAGTTSVTPLALGSEKGSVQFLGETHWFPLHPKGWFPIEELEPRIVKRLIHSYVVWEPCDPKSTIERVAEAI